MTLTNRLSSLRIAGLLVLLAMPAMAQSFNCHKAFFADERRICEEPPLGRLDSDLARLFGHVISRLPPQQRAALEREETAWVVARRRCGHDSRCIAGSYQRRMQTLGAMLAANEPEGIGERSLAARPSATPQARRRAEEKREPPGVASTRVPGSSGNESSNTAASGSTTRAPSSDFDIEPEVSPAARGSSGASAGGPMTPDR